MTNRCYIKTHEDIVWTIERQNEGSNHWYNIFVCRVTGNPHTYTNLDLAIDLLKIQEKYATSNEKYRITGINTNPIKEK